MTAASTGEGCGITSQLSISVRLPSILNRVLRYRGSQSFRRLIPRGGHFPVHRWGDNWQILAPADAAGIPTRIGCLVVDPFDTAHLCLGGVTHTAGGSDGMFVSRDGGVSWARQTFPGS